MTFKSKQKFVYIFFQNKQYFGRHLCFTSVYGNYLFEKMTLAQLPWLLSDILVITKYRLKSIFKQFLISFKIKTLITIKRLKQKSIKISAFKLTKSFNQSINSSIDKVRLGLRVEN